MAADIRSDAALVRRLLIVLALAAMAVLLWQLRHIVLLVFAAALFATLLRSISEPVSARTRMPEGVAVVLAALLIIATLVAAGSFFGWTTQAQVTELADLLPKAWAGFKQRLAHLPLGAHFLNDITKLRVRPDLSVFMTARGYVASATNVVTELFLVLVAGLYMALQPRMYRNGLLALMPEGARDRLRPVLDECGETLRRFLLTQLMAMVSIGVITGLALAVIGVPSALALGLFAGLVEFIPVAGPVIAAIPALLLALTGGWDMAGWTLLAFVLIQQVEGNVLIPLLQRGMIALPPVLTLFALLIGGVLFGPLGVLLATPVTAVLFIAVNRLYVQATLGEPDEMPREGG